MPCAANRIPDVAYRFGGWRKTWLKTCLPAVLESGVRESKSRTTLAWHDQYVCTSFGGSGVTENKSVRSERKRDGDVVLTVSVEVFV